MKLICVVALLCLAVTVNSQFIPPFGIPPFGLGFPFGLGLLGFPFPFLGLGLLGRGRLFGKREIEDMNKAALDKAAPATQKSEREVPAPIVPEPLVTCSITSADNLLKCSGSERTLQCALLPQLGELSSVELRVKDLDPIEVEGVADVLRLLGPKTQITAVHPRTKEDIVLALWSGKHASLVGFEVKDATCWAQVKLLASKLRPEEIRISLSISPK